MSGKFDKFNKAMKSAFDRVAAPSQVRQYGNMAAELIRKRTRLGYGVRSYGGSKERLKPLSDKYKTRRKDMDLSQNTTPAKSNLTKTGQLLDSIATQTVRKGQVRVGPGGRRTGESLTNEEVGEFVAEAGRPFNTLTDIEVKRIATEAANDINLLVKDELTRK